MPQKREKVGDLIGDAKNDKQMKILKNSTH